MSNFALAMHESHFCAKINTSWAGCGGPHLTCPQTACGPWAMCCAPL